MKVLSNMIDDFLKRLIFTVKSIMIIDVRILYNSIKSIMNLKSVIYIHLSWSDLGTFVYKPKD